MKKAIACLLALPLTLAACGAQTTQPAPTTAPEMTTEATTENGKSAPAEVTQPGITGRMRPCSTEVETAAGLYSLHELFNEAAKKLDQSVNRGILHKNNAARKKSQLALKLAKLA